jgi:hypothetical protein
MSGISPIFTSIILEKPHLPKQNSIAGPPMRNMAAVAFAGAVKQKARQPSGCLAFCLPAHQIP